MKLFSMLIVATFACSEIAAFADGKLVAKPGNSCPVVDPVPCKNGEGPIFVWKNGCEVPAGCRKITGGDWKYHYKEKLKVCPTFAAVECKPGEVKIFTKVNDCSMPSCTPSFGMCKPISCPMANARRGCTYVPASVDDNGCRVSCPQLKCDDSVIVVDPVPKPEGSSGASKPSSGSAQ